MKKIFIIFIILFAANIYASSLEERLTDPQTQKEAIKELWDKGDAAVPELRLMLVSSNMELREIALVRIINLKTKDFINEAKEILTTDKEFELRKLAMQYLCLIKEKSILEILKQMIISGNVDKKYYAIKSIGYIYNTNDAEYEEAVKILIEELKDKVNKIKLESAYQLAKLENKSGYNVAVENINSTDALEREKAVEIIGEIGDANDLGIIEQGMKDENVWVKIKAEIAKEKIGLQSGVSSQETGAKGRKMNRKAMSGVVGAGLAPAQKQKIAKLREILNSDKILDIKIWAANELLDMGEDGQKVAEEIIANKESGSYVISKEKINRLN